LALAVRVALGQEQEDSTLFFLLIPQLVEAQLNQEISLVGLVAVVAVLEPELQDKALTEVPLLVALPMVLLVEGRELLVLA
jgi:hypothetical protein